MAGRSARGLRRRRAGTGAGAQLNERPGAWPVHRRLTLFFVLAFLISWLVWPLTLLNPESPPMAPFGPAVAAVVVTLLSEGQEGLLRLVRQLGRWRVPVRWYLVAFGLPCLMVTLSAALTVAGGAPARDLGPNPGWVMLIGTFASTLVIVGLFQELGWRGYALPLLQRSHTALGAALLLGVVWGLWHVPELASDPTEQRPPVPFLLMVLAQSVLLAWIYNGTAASRAGRRATEQNAIGSVPLCMIFHAMFNTAGALIFPAFAGPDYLTFWWTLALLHVLAALVVIAFAGPWRLIRTLDTRPPHGIT
jgi:membrane protease YdiL (CAAX protease family)